MIHSRSSSFDDDDDYNSHTCEQCDEIDYQDYLDYIAQKQNYEDYLAEQQENYDTRYTYSGTSYHILNYVTNIQLNNTTATVYWNKEINKFHLCEPGKDDIIIDRIPENLKALAKILAFDPEEWGCGRCGCTAEFRDDEYICWCDTCVEGCDIPIRLEPLPDAPPRKPSQFFTLRRLLALPPPRTLERQIAIGGSIHSPSEDMHLSPFSDSLSPILVSAEDADRFMLDNM